MQQHIMYVYQIDAPVQPLAPLVVVAMNVNARIAVQLSLGGDIVLVCSSFVLGQFHYRLQYMQYANQGECPCVEKGVLLVTFDLLICQKYRTYPRHPPALQVLLPGVI